MHNDHVKLSRFTDFDYVARNSFWYHVVSPPGTLQTLWHLINSWHAWTAQDCEPPVCFDGCRFVRGDARAVEPPFVVLENPPSPVGLVVCRAPLLYADSEEVHQAISDARAKRSFFE